MPGCVFCDIVRAPDGSEVVWDDDSVLAFMDINPVTDGHVLVIPKAHATGLDDIPEAVAGRLMTVAQRVARALKSSTLRCEGVNLFFADGEAAFQEIFHSHLHVFPRYRGDGFVIDARWEGSTADGRRRAAEAITRNLER